MCTNGDLLQGTSWFGEKFFTSFTHAFSFFKSLQNVSIAVTSWHEECI